MSRQTTKTAPYIFGDRRVNRDAAIVRLARVAEARKELTPETLVTVAWVLTYSGRPIGDF